MRMPAGTSGAGAVRIRCRRKRADIGFGVSAASAAYSCGDCERGASGEECVGSEQAAEPVPE